jgi:hypothetical protein
VACLVAAVLAPGNTLAAGPVPQRPVNAHDQAVVERVRARAAARLEDPACRRLLTEFTDRHGRTLEENLRLLGVSASRYLLRLAFLDGSRLPVCQRPSVMMAVVPGLPHVFVCPAIGRLNSRLAAVEAGSGSLAEAMVIHEMLHTLGLGENPPSPSEITHRVRERCR